MKTFHYKALRPDGTTLHGILDANSRSDALRLLAQQELQPIRLTEPGVIESGSKPAPAPKRVPNLRKDLAAVLAWIALVSFVLGLTLPTVGDAPGWIVLTASFGATVVGLMGAAEGWNMGGAGVIGAVVLIGTIAWRLRRRGASRIFLAATVTAGIAVASVLGVQIILPVPAETRVTTIVGLAVAGAVTSTLMVSAAIAIIQNRRVAPGLAGLALILTVVVGTGLFHLDAHGLRTLSIGYFTWLGCAALVLVSAILQPEAPDPDQAIGQIGNKGKNN